MGAKPHEEHDILIGIETKMFFLILKYPYTYIMTDVVEGCLGITCKMKYASGVIESPVAKALVYDTH